MILRVLRKKRIPGPAHFPHVAVEAGHGVDPAPQGTNLIGIVVPVRVIQHKVKLNLLPVHVPVQVHHQRLRAAHFQSADHMENANHSSSSFIYRAMTISRSNSRITLSRPRRPICRFSS